VQASVGIESAWSYAHRTALGMHGESLRESAKAALPLYVETAQLIADALQPEHRDVVLATVERIARAGYARFSDHTMPKNSGLASSLIPNLCYCTPTFTHVRPGWGQI
jgi:hypothetical protein